MLFDILMNVGARGLNFFYVFVSLLLNFGFPNYSFSERAVAGSYFGYNPLWLY